MKSNLFALTGLAFLAALLAFSFKQPNETLSRSENTFNFQKVNSIGCSPDWSKVKDWIDEVDIPPIPGTGNYKWKISTKNDSAQFYFNQGITMYYSFHIVEAMASFKKASRIDPGCAMLQWAQALAYGPNINDLGYAASPDALTASN